MPFMSLFEMYSLLFFFQDDPQVIVSFFSSGPIFKNVWREDDHIVVEMIMWRWWFLFLPSFQLLGEDSLSYIRGTLTGRTETRHFLLEVVGSVFLSSHRMSRNTMIIRKRRKKVWKSDDNLEWLHDPILSCLVVRDQGKRDRRRHTSRMMIIILAGSGHHHHHRLVICVVSSSILVSIFSSSSNAAVLVPSTRLLFHVWWWWYSLNIMISLILKDQERDGNPLAAFFRVFESCVSIIKLGLSFSIPWWRWSMSCFVSKSIQSLCFFAWISSPLLPYRKTSDWIMDPLL